MKIAITSSGEALNSPIDVRFGRARYFVLFDTDTREFEVVDNRAGIDAVQGAGVQAAEKVSCEGAGVLITGHCGPNAFRTLRAAGIEVVVGASGSVKDAVDSYENGTLKAADQPDVDGHWV